ncbi:hypothetical protein CRE_17446 [Caenorhabditis remanei]|uniref:DUF38 domain-containing protein n=1 Tax=Caenorhabditis remanei TaxID=31234 RepID=E3N231_CAERE|nr:hypothetical protein CRE_17446 [Caenorhabditis remanei]
MPFPLSYPGLKCILEHLEAVKRVHIIGRSPGLQKIDKLIPFCLENFTIDSEDNLTINKLTIECYRDNVIFRMNGKTFSRQISLSQEDTIKKCINFYICGRSITRVDKLDWFRRLTTNFLPVGLKLRVNSLNADLETVILFIDSQSPLKTLITTNKYSSLFDNQVVQLAETLLLILVTHRTVTVEDIKKLNNKTVEFKRHSFSRIDIIPLVKYHIETKKEFRTTFIISTDETNFIDMMLQDFEQAFGEFQCDLQGVNERYVKYMGVKPIISFQAYSRIFCVL